VRRSVSVSAAILRWLALRHWLIHKRFPCKARQNSIASGEELHTKKKDDYDCDNRRPDEKTEVLVTAVTSEAIALLVVRAGTANVQRALASVSFRRSLSPSHEES
jgi:hypothetical protein